jgi:hypothetical protein
VPLLWPNCHDRQRDRGRPSKAPHCGPRTSRGIKVRVAKIRTAGPHNPRRSWGPTATAPRSESYLGRCLRGAIVLHFRSPIQLHDAQSGVSGRWIGHHHFPDNEQAIAPRCGRIAPERLDVLRQQILCRRYVIPSALSISRMPISAMRQSADRHHVQQLERRFLRDLPYRDE